MTLSSGAELVLPLTETVAVTIECFGTEGLAVEVVAGELDEGEADRPTLEQAPADPIQISTATTSGHLAAFTTTA